MTEVLGLIIFLSVIGIAALALLLYAETKGWLS